MVNFLTEAMPILTFGFRIQYDTLQGVASDDYGRLAVVYLEWASQVTKVLGVLIPFVPFPSALWQTYTAVGVDLVEHAAFDFPKLNLMFQQRIVGLLSSSYQGNATLDPSFELQLQTSRNLSFRLRPPSNYSRQSVKHRAFTCE